MVAVFLTGIAVIGIYRGYVSFSQSADAQEQNIEMQQNLRIGMYRLEKHLRRTGMNEEDDDNAGFEVADDATMTFTMDMGGADGSVDDETWNPGDAGDSDLEDNDERLGFKVEDIDIDGITDLVLIDENNGDPSAAVDTMIITNVDALNFVYLDEDSDPIPGTPLVAGDRDRIRTVQVAIVVRTTNEDYRYTNNETYRNLQDSLRKLYE